MLTVKELRKLRDEKVFKELRKRSKPKPKRKRGVRPPDAKQPGGVPVAAVDRTKKK